MNQIEDKQRAAILRILRDADGQVSSAAITRALEARGVELSDRTVRHYLQEMERAGLVEAAARGRSGGRRITARGQQEIKDSLVFERIGFTAAKVDAMAWRMDFDLARRQGRIVLNMTMIARGHLEAALNQVIPVLEARLGMGEYLALFEGPDRVENVRIPGGYVGIGTICSVTINGVLLGARVPVVSRFGAMLEMRDRQPVRFTDVIHYEGTSIDPLEIFIKAGLTSVRELTTTGNGRIGVSFREVPTCALPQVERVLGELSEAGLGGVLILGKPNQPLLDFTVQEGRTGLLVTGGMNPVAAIEESGIPTQNTALSCLCDFDRMIHFSKVR